MRRNPKRSANPAPEYRWNERSGRYVAASGRYVTRQAVRASLDAAIEKSGERVRSLTEDLRTGKVTLAAWRLDMAQELKSVHLASAALARGGWAQLTQADFGRVGQKMREQYAYLERFAGQVESGKQKLDGTLGRRAQLYIAAGRGTYHAVDLREQQRRGMTEEKSIRHALDSCPGCVREAAKGWAPIGTLVQIGSRQCLTRCKCGMDYR